MNKGISFFRGLLMILASVLLPALSTRAQVKNGEIYLGPSLGLSFLGSTAQLGGNLEFIVEEKSIGICGVGGLIRYWSYSENYSYSILGFSYGGKWKYSNVLVAGQGNYHFNVSNPKLDPFVGIIAGYDIASTSWEGQGSAPVSVSAGGFVGNAHGGLRYFLKEKMALVARLGYGTLSYGALDVGLDFKL